MGEKLVGVAHFLNMLDANHARKRLEAEGIECVVAEASGSGVWPSMKAVGGIILRVRESVLERAKAIIL